MSNLNGGPTVAELDALKVHLETRRRKVSPINAHDTLQRALVDYRADQKALERVINLAAGQNVMPCDTVQSKVGVLIEKRLLTVAARIVHNAHVTGSMVANLGELDA